MPITFTLSAAANAANGATAYTGTITGEVQVSLVYGVGIYVGARVVVVGFDFGANNGTFTCVASTTTQLVLQNPSGVADIHAATATVAWVLACKELGGTVYVTRLSQTVDDRAPGFPSTWYPVGPGLRPSIQAYAGNGLSTSQFIVMFEYLSHLACRVLDVVTWPPSSVDPVTFSPTSIQLPEDAVALKLLSATSLMSDSYYFNPVNAQASALFFDPATDIFSVTISLAAGWVPLFLGSATAFYRLYRRPIGTLPWTLVMDWDTTISFPDSNVGSFRFEYTATWGTGARPSNPNVNTDHNEGVIGGGNVISVDSNQALDFTANSLPGDSLNFGVPTTKQSTNAAFFGDPKLQFLAASVDEVINLLESSIENSILAAPTGDLGGFPAFAVTTGDDQLIPTLASSPPTSGAVLLQTNANAARAGMY